MAKPSSEFIKQLLNKCQYTLESNAKEKFTTPLGKMLEQTNDVNSLTYVSLKMIELEPNYLECLQPSRREPEYWSNLDSS